MSDLNSQEVSNFCRNKKGEFYTQEPNVFSASNVFSLEKLNDFEAEFYLIVHKGLIQEIQAKYFAQLSGRSSIAFSNDVYIIFHAKEISKMKDPVKSFYHAIKNLVSPLIEQSPSERNLTNLNSGRFCQYMGGNTILTETSFGRKIYLDSRDISLTPHIAYEGTWESWITNYISNNLKPGDTFIDMGANCGFYSILAGHIVGPEGFVIAVEPQEILYNNICKSISINGFNDFFHIEKCAVGANIGQGKLNQNRALQGSSSLLELGDDEFDVVDVQIQTFPEILNKIKNQKKEIEQAVSQITEQMPNHLRAKTILPDMIKIDVEGYEYNVWKGMEDFVKSNHPNQIIMEYGPYRYMELNQDPIQFIADIEECNYQIYEIATNGQLSEFNKDEAKRVIKEYRFADLILVKSGDV